MEFPIQAFHTLHIFVLSVLILSTGESSYTFLTSISNSLVLKSTTLSQTNMAVLIISCAVKSASKCPIIDSQFYTKKLLLLHNTPSVNNYFESKLMTSTTSILVIASLISSLGSSILAIPSFASQSGKLIRLIPKGHTAWNVHASEATNYAVIVTHNPKSDPRWRVLPGLTGEHSTVSFEKVGAPGRYMRHRSYVLHADRYSDTIVNRYDATFRVVQAIHPKPSSLFPDFISDLVLGPYISLEAANFPGHYVVLDGATLRISQFVDTDMFRLRATWQWNGTFDSQC